MRSCTQSACDITYKSFHQMCRGEIHFRGCLRPLCPTDIKIYCMTQYISLQPNCKGRTICTSNMKHNESTNWNFHGQKHKVSISSLFSSNIQINSSSLIENTESFGFTLSSLTSPKRTKCPWIFSTREELCLLSFKRNSHRPTCWLLRSWLI